MRIENVNNFDSIDRCVFDPVRDYAGRRGAAHRVPGAGHRPTAPQGSHWRLGADFSLPGRHRHRIHRRLFQRRSLLQHHHRLVSLLPLPGPYFLFSKISVHSSLIRIFQSFQYPLPWSECPKEYFDNGSYVTNMECKVRIDWFLVLMGSGGCCKFDPIRRMLTVASSLIKKTIFSCAIAAEQPDAVLLVQRNAGHFARHQHAAEFQLENHPVPVPGLASSLPVHGQR